MTLYQALYNPMTEESSAETLSIHLTRDGAESAIKAHRDNEFDKWNNLYPNKEDEPYPFGAFEEWEVGEIEVLP